MNINRIIFATMAIIVSVFAFFFSLLMAIPVAILAIIAGKQLQKRMQESQATPAEHNVIEGEYQDLSKESD